MEPPWPYCIDMSEPGRTGGLNWRRTLTIFSPLVIEATAFAPSVVGVFDGLAAVRGLMILPAAVCAGFAIAPGWPSADGIIDFRMATAMEGAEAA
eukprot:7004716-Prymnesium_polylepis.1